ncbi:UDP-N-acetylglucosamine--N-acetylmuramyl-(pentapeptide) pyrophosphoryl-undecaprenol N-acetylglucosamine transferase [Candidatus Desulfarcum epimagneticum]|uniref:UDP-N-acetylglucosamine--N-acetylmuramyl-(pentapeptide) pyrophosphoryl-undecaprenol N-acetylglucosamine transferase n=1 Tax=uncultured Desulfobacteraceae bacterium TaxID=218296 RepID=A0A484HLJ5_9BACT|nr:UDP-N-acetylglucosamine--N-acetylmuramyl-(pentapeptide) pyrophosphoryl-undecaprenol N-acetylglucosamine transferase [uncultured Desulfobacteraceae bacterium]
MKSADHGKKDRPLAVVIAGGGTGGHLFPAISLAEAFQDKAPGVRILFVNTGNAFETKTLSREGFSFQKIPARGLKGKGLAGRFKTLMILPRGIFRSISILRAFRPDLVVGVGGYSSGPAGLAAKFLGIPLALHEQNILPGIANRFLSLFAARVYVSFDDTRLSSGKAFLPAINPARVLVTGNPIRRRMRKGIGHGKKNGGAFRVLILGGSQGARAINEAVMDALGLFKEDESVFLTHQTGEKDAAEVAAAYRRSQTPGRVRAFFHDMDRRYAEADLILCRAGAGTVSEIAAMGKAAVFVPFPFAADNHQVLNAMSMKEKGAAEIIFQDDLTGPRIYEMIKSYQSDRRPLLEMAKKAGETGRPEAADRIVEDCLRLTGRL